MGEFVEGFSSWGRDEEGNTMATSGLPSAAESSAYDADLLNCRLNKVRTPIFCRNIGICIFVSILLCVEYKVLYTAEMSIGYGAVVCGLFFLRDHPKTNVSPQLYS